MRPAGWWAGAGSRRRAVIQHTQDEITDTTAVLGSQLTRMRYPPTTVIVAEQQTDHPASFSPRVRVSNISPLIMGEHDFTVDIVQSPLVIRFLLIEN